MIDAPVKLSTVLDGEQLKLAAELEKCGYVIVPRRPTRAMVLAGMNSLGAYTAFRRMLEAAPKLV